MKKDSLAKFIDRSKAIINAELKAERQEVNEDDEIISLLKADEDTEIMENKSTSFTSSIQSIKTQKQSQEACKTIDKSYIAKNVSVKGNVFVKGNLCLDGMIDGNLEYCHDLIVNGYVNGNIILSSDKELYDSTMHTQCEISERAHINGDVFVDDLILTGKITGKVHAKGKVTLNSCAVLAGDCITSLIEVKEGAIIKGNVETKPVQ